MKSLACLIVFAAWLLIISPFAFMVNSVRANNVLWPDAAIIYFLLG